MRAVLIIFASVFLFQAQAFGQANAPSQAPRAVPGIPLQELANGDTFLETVGRYWEGVRGLFSIRSTISVASSAHATQTSDTDFQWLMNIAGYKLKEIESTISLLPGLGLNFAQARELTDADRDYVERELERHARLYPGPLAAIQRSIVYGVLEASDLGKFAIDKVEIDLLPLPKVKILMAPVDAPLSLETSRVLRAIERLNNSINAQTPRQRGTQLPSWIPENGIVPISAPRERRL